MKKKLKSYFENNYLKIISGFLLIIMLLLGLWDKISTYIKTHDALFFSIFFIFLLLFLEIISLIKKK